MPEMSLITETFTLLSAIAGLTVAVIALLRGRSEQSNRDGQTDTLMKALNSFDVKIADSEKKTREWVELRLHKEMTDIEKGKAIETERESLMTIKAKLKTALSRLDAGESIETIEKDYSNLATDLPLPYTGSTAVFLVSQSLFGGLIATAIDYFTSRRVRRETFRSRLAELISLVESQIDELDKETVKFSVKRSSH